MSCAFCDNEATICGECVEQGNLSLKTSMVKAQNEAAGMTGSLAQLRLTSRAANKERAKSQAAAIGAERELHGVEMKNRILVESLRELAVWECSSYDPAGAWVTFFQCRICKAETPHHPVELVHGDCPLRKEK